jgi:hypothetical protein
MMMAKPTTWVLNHPKRVLLVMGLAVHALVVSAVFYRSGEIAPYAFASLDSREYYELAGNLLHHGVFSHSAEPPHEPDFWRVPGYPLFLAALMAVGGESPEFLVMAQHVLSIANVLLVFVIASSLLSPPRALIAAAVFLLEPYHLFYANWLLATTWFTTLILLLWWLWARRQSLGILGHVLIGVLSGFAILVRPVAILVPFLLAIGVLWREIRHRRGQGAWGRALRCGVPLIVCAMLIVGSWMYRNYRLSGHGAISNQGGVVLAYFKATEIVLWAEGRTADRYIETSLDPGRRMEPHSVWDGIDEQLRDKFAHLPVERQSELSWQNLAQGNRSSVDSFAVSSTLGEIGWERIRQNPLATVTCCLARMGSMLTFPLNLAVSPQQGQSRSAANVVLGLGYLLLVAAAAVQVIRAPRRGDVLVFPILVLLSLAVATSPQVDPRFRVPLIPLLTVLAVLGPVRQTCSDDLGEGESAGASPDESADESAVDVGDDAGSLFRPSSLSSS